jgi:DNA-binding CsgD family transcriptional regulator
MKVDLQKEILNYNPILQHFKGDEIYELKNTILGLKDFGISAYAERIINLCGNSIKFCNSEEWGVLEQEKPFFNDFSEHVSLELVRNFKYRNKIITRSKDKIFNNFLQKLENKNLNNSVIVNEFHENYITISYFMVDPSLPVNRDVILSNINAIEAIRKKTLDSIIKLFLSKKLCKYQKKLLTKEAREIIFKPVDKSMIQLNWNGFFYEPTSREGDCLYILSTGASNKLIARCLKISTETVKFHLKNLRDKTGASSRDELIEVALASLSSNPQFYKARSEF